jgi:hypothetical protein
MKKMAIFKSIVAYFGAIGAGLFAGLLVSLDEVTTCIVGIVLGLFLALCAGYAAIQEWQDLRTMEDWDEEEN